MFFIRLTFNKILTLDLIQVMNQTYKFDSFFETELLLKNTLWTL